MGKGCRLPAGSGPPAGCKRVYTFNLIMWTVVTHKPAYSIPAQTHYTITKARGRTLPATNNGPSVLYGLHGM